MIEFSCDLSTSLLVKFSCECFFSFLDAVSDYNTRSQMGNELENGMKSSATRIRRRILKTLKTEISRNFLAGLLPQIESMHEKFEMHVRESWTSSRLNARERE